MRERAECRCEYCRFPEQFAELPFEVDHIVARQHGGETRLDNLALACCHCNRSKGPNLVAIDPESGHVVRLFNPRRDVWERHFYWQGARLVARTPIGGATIRLLQINREIAVAVRALLMQAGEYAGRGVIRWEWRYHDLGILDGTHWSLDIAYDDIEMRSSGDNAYPDNEPAAPSRTFMRLLRAVSRLVGGRAFR